MEANTGAEIRAGAIDDNAFGMFIFIDNAEAFISVLAEPNQTSKYNVNIKDNPFKYEW